MGLFSWLRRASRASGTHSEQLAALDRRVEALEAAQSDLQEAVQHEAERAARWADMSQQLRRFLGRLDAHAGKEREREAESNGGAKHDPKQLAALLRTKFPHTGG